MCTVPAVRQAIALLCLVSYLPACTGWHSLAATQPVPQTERDQSFRVTLQDGTRLELRKARVRGDSLVGESGSKPVRTALALEQIKRIEDRRVDAGLTMSAIFAGLGLAVVVAAGTINFGGFSRP
jgi:hypothetical protein